MKYDRLSRMILTEAINPNDVYVEISEEPNPKNTIPTLTELAPLDVISVKLSNGKRIGSGVVAGCAYLTDGSATKDASVRNLRKEHGYGYIIRDQFNRQIQGLLNNNSISFSIAEISRMGFIVYENKEKMVSTITLKETDKPRPLQIEQLIDMFTDKIKKIVATYYESLSKDSGKSISLSLQSVNFYSMSIFANGIGVGSISPNEQDVKLIEKHISSETISGNPTEKTIADAFALIPTKPIRDPIQFKDQYYSIENNGQLLFSSILSNLDMIKKDAKLDAALMANFDSKGDAASDDRGSKMTKDAAYGALAAFKKYVPSGTTASHLTGQQIEAIKVYMQLDLDKIAELYKKLGVTSINLTDFTPQPTDYTTSTGEKLTSKPIDGTPVNIVIYKGVALTPISPSNITIKNLASKEFTQMVSNRLFSSKTGWFGQANMMQLMNRLKGVFDAVHKRNNLNDITVKVEAKEIQRGARSVEDAVVTGLSKLFK